MLGKYPTPEITPPFVKEWKRGENEENKQANENCQAFIVQLMNLLLIVTGLSGGNQLRRSFTAPLFLVMLFFWARE